jgi:hypothetical protein
MNRMDALTYLKEEYSELATEASYDADTCVRFYSRAIDRALRDLGFREDEIAVATLEHGSDITALCALLDYYALERYCRVFATRTDVSVSGAVSASQSQTFKQVAQLRDTAAARLLQLGLGPTEEFSLGRMTLDFLEPDTLVEGFA